MYKSPLLASMVSYDKSVLREPYKSWKKLPALNPDNTSYRNNGSAQMLNAYIVRALDAFAGGGGTDRLDIGAVMIADGSDDNKQVSYATQWKKYVTKPDGSKEPVETVLVHATSNGFLFGSVVDLSGIYHQFPPFGNAKDEFDLTSLMLNLILIEADKAKYEERNGNHISWELLQSAKDDVDHQGYVSENTVRIVCDEIQCGLQDSDDTKRIKFSMVKNVVNLLSKDRIDSNEFASGKIVCGDPDILKPMEFRATIKNIKGVTIREMIADPAIAAYRASQPEWTPDEQLMIPSYPLDMIVPYFIALDCYRVAKSFGTLTPFVNFEWKGKTGFGKTVGTEIMAQILNKPKVSKTCSSNTEIEKFLYEYIPEERGSFDVEDLPTYEDIMMDPEAAYQRMTGEYVEGVSYQAVLEAYGKEFAKAYNQTPGYKLVESDYVKALRRGYLVEIQEPSRIRDSGVLPGLNNFDKPGALIPRPDGTKCTRSPYAIVYFTDNVGYAGCRPMDASVIRRMCTVHTSYVVDKAMALDRLKANVPALTDAQRKRLYNIWEGIVRFCKDNDITEGDISIVELELWGAVVSWEGEADLLESCIDCVISKATNDPDTQEELIDFVKLKLSDQY